MSLSDEKKKLYRKFAINAIHKSENILINTFDIIYIPYKHKAFSNKIQNKIGLAVPLRDQKYYATDIETWRELIKYDWTNKRKYLDDKRDCDDYAEKFAANMSWLYGLNSVLPVSVQLLEPDTGKHIGYHRACIIPTKDALYMYDPMEGMEDAITKIEDKDSIVIKNWRYRSRIIRL